MKSGAAAAAGVMALVLVGCGRATVETGSEPIASADALQGALPSTRAPVPRIYVDHLTLDFGSAPGPHLRSFDAAGAQGFTLQVTNYDDGGEPDSVPFHVSLYYASRGHWRLFRAVDSSSSTATITATPSRARHWLVAIQADRAFHVMQSALSCSSGHACALAAQPGDACDASTSCDRALYCDPGAACGTSGSCRLASDVCDLQRVGPACGCDGTDYASACDAAHAAVGVVFAGHCGSPPPAGCDPATSWQPIDIALGGITRTRTWSSADGQSVYVFDAASSTVNVTSGGASRSASFGVSSFNAKELDLAFADATAQTFSELANCNGDRMLTATSKGLGLTLVPGP